MTAAISAGTGLLPRRNRTPLTSSRWFGKRRQIEAVAMLLQKEDFDAVIDKFPNRFRLRTDAPQGFMQRMVRDVLGDA